MAVLLYIYIYIYLYMYMCVCVCLCVCMYIIQDPLINRTFKTTAYIFCNNLTLLLTPMITFFNSNLNTFFFFTYFIVKKNCKPCDLENLIFISCCVFLLT